MTHFLDVPDWVPHSWGGTTGLNSFNCHKPPCHPGLQALCKCTRVLYVLMCLCLSMAVTLLKQVFPESFHETSRRISPLWELLPSNLSWRPIGSCQSKWLANFREACKYELERQYKLRQNLFLHFAVPRLWLKLLQLTVKVRSFEGRPHGCSSAAFRWVWHFLKDSPSALWSAVDLRDSGDELMPTKCLHSSHRRTYRTGHQPGFSRPSSMAVRRAEGRCGSKGISRRCRCRTERATG